VSACSDPVSKAPGMGFAGSAPLGGGPPTAGTGTSGSFPGGAIGVGGTSAAGGTPMATAGSSPLGGSAGTAPNGGVGGASAQAGGPTAGTAGAAASACPAQCISNPASSQSCAPCFSFFATSLEAMQQLSNSKSGFGGDLRFGEADGLAGGDKICRTIATDIVGDAMTIAGQKTWRAFLSVTNGPSGGPVHARDRIGNGPWYDRTGRLLAANLNNLIQERPTGADPAIRDDFPNEQGIPNHGGCRPSPKRAARLVYSSTKWAVLKVIRSAAGAATAASTASRS
jgi:hypothetical protein